MVINGMDARFVWLCVLASTAFGAAPIDLTNKVYRETTINVPARGSSERTIIFQANGRYTYVFAGGGNALSLAAPYRIFLGPPPPDGEFSYTRIDDSHARLTLDGDDGTREVCDLIFTGAIGGTLGGRVPADETTFTLTDSWAGLAPLANVSMRGTVSPGHPLIAGFVIPGQPYITDRAFKLSPDIAVREALIRVVGPGLVKFGVSNPWPDPQFELHPGGTTEAVYSDWSVAIRNLYDAPGPNHATEAGFDRVFTTVGAFPLEYGSTDAAAIVRLSPGVYTVVCTTPPGDPGGDALIEVYLVP